MQGEGKSVVVRLMWRPRGGEPAAPRCGDVGVVRSASSQGGTARTECTGSTGGIGEHVRPSQPSPWKQTRRAAARHGESQPGAIARVSLVRRLGVSRYGGNAETRSHAVPRVRTCALRGRATRSRHKARL